ncbi:inositol-tetrakisphosphate 1-kinase 3-like isoform X1 [Salvia miltiorrhiza]|uniref:inositol-tetrakisphosphate 1-kinase 3-like isoform X1 n=2 Tax=Salvia miltiorrhiza TaxID=226208 RepID=UPI0025ACF7D5|nr:inositol-tetrakisphosphate 1-kinase 3-like isoform X1 [Salvia miltiorrhiza]
MCLNSIRIYLYISIFRSSVLGMRMGGEIAYFKEENKDEEVIKDRELEDEKMVAQMRYSAAAIGGGFSPPPSTMKVVVVGYALTSKKIKSFLQPKLEGLARNKGILFVAIDLSKPLSDQGPFDIVLHKLSGKEWQCILEDYRITHPNVTVLDPPDAIEHVYSRQSMLQVVAELNLSDPYGKVGVPEQLVIKKDSSSIPDSVNMAGLRLPLVAKPLFAKSHELSLAYDELSLQKLEPPLVLQEFINHGGVLFKVYIVGEAIKVLRRFSLPDVSKRELKTTAGVYRFPRVSCAAASADEADLDPHVAELPPRPLLERLAKELRHRLGLRLFNLDMIREHGTRDRYYVIDINYFPGYGKMPEYEHIFTDFLLSLAPSK